MKKLSLRGLVWAVLAALVTSLAHAEEVTVAVAANFSAPAQKIADDFARSSGHTLRLVAGSTGKLYAQIKNGAPFQVLLSADDATPARLLSEQAAMAGSQFTYATGRLVLWSKQAGLVDAQGAVLRSAFTHLAVADPKLAPYGAAAMQVLDALGLRASVQARIVQGESIGQAYQFVQSGNAPLGFVALSQVMQGGQLREGSAWVVPTAMHSPLRQDAVLLLPGKNSAGAQALLAYLRSDAAKTVIRSYGYLVP